MVGGGRKYNLAAFSLISGFMLSAFSKLTGEYTTLVSVVMASFAAADTFITRKSLDQK